MKFSILLLSLACSLTSYATDKDRGGGNTIEGRPIESYAVDIQQSSAFQNALKPIVRNIKKFSPVLYAQMLAVIEQKLWYVVPVPLDVISPEILGLVFQSDQAAMQSERSVWVNNTIFKSMTPADQATLILHELFLGVRLQEIASSENPGRKLSAIDYEQIRFITVKVFRAGSNLKFIDLQGFLKSQDFGNYPERSPSHLNFDQLLNVINPIAGCTVSYEKTANNAVVHISGNTNSQIRTGLQPELTRWDGFFETYSLPEISADPKEGDTRQHLAIHLKENKAHLLFLTKQRYGMNKEQNALSWQYDSLIRQCGSNIVATD